MGALVYLLLMETLGYRPRFGAMGLFALNFFHNGRLLGVSAVIFLLQNLGRDIHGRAILFFTQQSKISYSIIKCYFRMYINITNAQSGGVIYLYLWKYFFYGRLVHDFVGNFFH
eukprot:99128_1